MLKVYTLEQTEQWDGVVLSFRDYDAYWLSGYVKAFWKHGDGEPMLFLFDNGTVRGINVVMKRDVARDPHFDGKLEEGRFFDFATPYGYGGWLIEGEDTSSLFESYDMWTKKNGIVSEFVRFHPMIKNHEICSGFYDIAQLGEVVHMELKSADLIWDNITSKNRNMIRKAEKNGIKIFNGRFPDIYKQFRIIYDQTMERDGADNYYFFNEQFYESILNDLPFNAQMFWAEKDGQIIAASIMLAANKKMNYHLSGSLHEYGTLAPTNLLLYKAALWGAANGYETLYLGGGVGSGEDGLFKFKKSFYKGQLNHFYIGKRIINQEEYDKLLAIRGSVERPEFFPKYRG